ncbi:MAG: hypothetical protein ABJL67_15760 [Sulfitobacter sp.]
MTDEAVQTPIKFTYKNWRGEVAERCVLPIGTLERKATQFHPEPQWIMRAWDYDKKAYRDFALSDCQFTALEPAPMDVAEAARVLLCAMPNHAMERAALESRANDDEGQFQSLSDLLDFSGQNKSYTVVREAICEALRALATREGE